MPIFNPFPGLERKEHGVRPDLNSIRRRLGEEGTSLISCSGCKRSILVSNEGGVKRVTIECPYCGCRTDVPQNRLYRK